MTSIKGLVCLLFALVVFTSDNGAEGANVVRQDGNSPLSQVVWECRIQHRL